ncbi:MAG: hypothetical protein QXR53_02335 [Candidatus Norongarragalinales archaeon]
MKFSLTLCLLSPSLAFAHSTGNTFEQLSATLLNTALYALAFVVIIAITAAVFKEELGDKGKKAAFVLIALIVVATTLYLGGSIVWVNLNSASGGPVHWHADYEVWACGEKIEMQMSEGLSNKIGTQLFHHHNDMRIHVEGVVMNLEDVELGEFFEAIGGEFTKDELKVVLQDGTVQTLRNGDLCPDGHAGTLKLYVNGELNKKMNEYVIKPYSQVPPGDVLKIVFD